MVSVSIIGVGRIGGALALSLPPEKYRLDNLIVRRDHDLSAILEKLASAPHILPFDSLEIISSDIIFITTQDAHLASVSKKLPSIIRGTPVVFHTSGSYSSGILDDVKAVGCDTGSLHPLVSISLPELGPVRFRNAFFCVEGTVGAAQIGLDLVADLGGRPFTIDTKFKTLYHAAAVTACGHLVALFDAAVEMMAKCGISPEESKNILMPLVTSTVQNLNEQSTSAALTGTFARADIETFTRHLTALNESVSDELLEIYLLLGERSLELAAKQGVNPERIDTLRTKVSIAKSKLKW